MYASTCVWHHKLSSGMGLEARGGYRVQRLAHTRAFAIKCIVSCNYPRENGHFDEEDDGM